MHLDELEEHWMQDPEKASSYIFKNDDLPNEVQHMQLFYNHMPTSSLQN